MEVVEAGAGAHFASTDDVEFMVVRLEDDAGGSRVASKAAAGMSDGELLPMPGMLGAGGSGSGDAAQQLLQLDDIEVVLDEVAAGLAPTHSDLDAAEGGTSGAAAHQPHSLGTRRGLGNLQGPLKVNVLGQMKSQRPHGPLPPIGQGLAPGIRVQPSVEVGGVTPEAAAAATAVGKLRLDPKVKKYILDGANLSELYAKAGTTRSTASQRAVQLAAPQLATGTVLGSAAATAAAAAGRLTYQLVANSQELQKAAHFVQRRLMEEKQRLNELSGQVHAFEFALLMDNSGSMVRLLDEAKHSMVLASEVLRRLECPFAVVRFGRAHGQVVLKSLHEPFSAQVMELALEALTCDEGTYPASACDFVMREVFKCGDDTPGGAGASAMSTGPRSAAPRSPALRRPPAPRSAPQRNADAPGATTSDGGSSTDGGVVRHQVILAVLDGLTSEMAHESYAELRRQGVDLLVLNLFDKRQQEMMGRIGDLWSAVASGHELLDTARVEDFPRALAHLITSYFARMCQEAEQLTRTRSGVSIAAAATSPDGSVGNEGTVAGGLSAPVLAQRAALVPELTRGLRSVGHMQYADAQQQGGLEPRRMFAHSPVGAPLPFAALLEQLQQQQGGQSDSAAGTLVQARERHTQEVLNERLPAFYAAVQQAPQYLPGIEAVRNEWAAARARVAPQVQRLVEVMEDVVLPFNKHTRKRSAERGASLHVPGLIKFVATDGSHTAIFGAKRAGGRREYRVAVAVDASSSMSAHLRACALEGVLMLTSALADAGVDDFVVVTFGRGVSLIKSAETPWDEMAQWTLVQAMFCWPGHQGASQDGDAIEAVLDLLSACGSRGAKKAFVLTDGYSDSAERLAAALQRAEAENAEVVGLALGFDRTNTPRAYQRWATAALPAALPDALEALYAQDAEAAGSHGSSMAAAEAAAAAGAAGDEAEHLAVVTRGAALTVREALANESQERVFKDLVSKLSADKEAKVLHTQPDSMTIDVCFVLDVTGSMAAWLEACKAQIGAIISGLLHQVQKKASDALPVSMCWALVAYRDACDGANQLETVDFCTDGAQLVAKVKSLTAHGGGDEPEDMMAALDAAACLDWRSKARFGIVITDAPAHGAECNNDPGDTYPGGSPRSGCSVAEVAQRLRQQQVDVMLMPVRSGTLDQTAAELRRHYDCQQEDRKLSCTPLFNSNVQPSGAFHFVFCLDESGSMAGTPWEAVKAAYNQLLARRTSDQCQADLVSVVTFNSNVRVQAQCVPLSAAPTRLAYSGGGTEFSPAVDASSTIISAAPAGYTPIFVFMSDGCDGASNAEGAMRQLYAAHAHRNLQVHTIAFGSAIPKLKAMATAGNGTYHGAVDGVQLTQVFTQIAAECTAVDGLVERFGEILSDMVTTKIVLDYL